MLSLFARSHVALIDEDLVANKHTMRLSVGQPGGVVQR